MAVVDVEGSLALLASAGGTSTLLIRKHLVVLLGGKPVARERTGAPLIGTQRSIFPLVRDRLPVPFGARILQSPLAAVAGAAKILGEYRPVRVARSWSASPCFVSFRICFLPPLLVARRAFSASPMWTVGVAFGRTFCLRHGCNCTGSVQLQFIRGAGISVLPLDGIANGKVAVGG